MARVLKELGHSDVLATGFVGGANGDLIVKGLGAEGIAHDFIRTKNESRLCIAIVDPEKGTQTEVNENGPEVTNEELNALKTRIEQLIDGTEYLCLLYTSPSPRDS